MYPQTAGIQKTRIQSNGQLPGWAMPELASMLTQLNGRQPLGVAGGHGDWMATRNGARWPGKSVQDVILCTCLHFLCIFKSLFFIFFSVCFFVFHSVFFRLLPSNVVSCKSRGACAQLFFVAYPNIKKLFLKMNNNSATEQHRVRRTKKAYETKQTTAHQKKMCIIFYEIPWQSVKVSLQSIWCCALLNLFV